MASSQSAGIDENWRHATSASTDAATGVPTADALKKGLIATEISQRTAKSMTILFVVFILSLPLIQAAIEFRRGQSIQALEILKFREIPSKKALTDFEIKLRDASVAKQFIQPRAQRVLTAYLGYGNSKVVVGLSGWLFYQPGIEYLNGLPLLDKTALRLRTKKLLEAESDLAYPDPRPAITQFHRDCQAAGVHLIVVPVPDKAMLQPAQLTSRYSHTEPISVPDNPGFKEFVDSLRDAGVDVFDMRPKTLAPGTVRFLQHDTHWTPEWMEQVARELAAHANRSVALPAPDRSYRLRVEPRQITNSGDIANMLKMGETEADFPPQTVTIQRIVQPEFGQAWSSDNTADVVLLGDSFSNIYSAEAMGWGVEAGLGAQLSRFLERRVEVIARNGSGATATRAEFAALPNPWVGKRLIIWEFAMRDLVSQNWTPIPVPPTSPIALPSYTAPSNSKTQDALIIDGELLTKIRAFDVDDYPDVLLTLRFKVRDVLAGICAKPEVLVRTFGAKNRKLMPAASFQTGQVYRLILFQTAPGGTETIKTLNFAKATDLPLWASDIQLKGAK